MRHHGSNNGNCMEKLFPVNGDNDAGTKKSLLNIRGFLCRRLVSPRLPQNLRIRFFCHWHPPKRVGPHRFYDVVIDRGYTFFVRCCKVLAKVSSDIEMQAHLLNTSEPLIGPVHLQYPFFTPDSNWL